MREFSYLERKFIVENQDSMQLGKIARKFNCSWREVYDCFSKIIKTKPYQDFVQRRRENIKNGGCFDERIEYFEGEENKNRERNNNQLRDTSLPFSIRTSRNARHNNSSKTL